MKRRGGRSLESFKAMIHSKICIVDDDRIARENCAALLHSEEYDLAFAQSGQSLLANLPEIRPDVILLDVMMPGMDGFEVCQALKSGTLWRSIPIILVTALDSREDLIRGLNAGADEFLAKPVNGPELRARIRTMLRIKRQHDRLRATLKLRQDLANMIVHDMRVPLGAIMLYCELMRQRGKLGSEDRTDLEVVDSQARRLDGFVNDMLQIAKMEGGKLILQRNPVDVNELVNRLREVHCAVAESRGVDLHFDLPLESPVLELDASLFGRVLDNLLSNALKVSRGGQSVRLEVFYPMSSGDAEPESPEVELRVTDEGPGIPVEQREMIFDMFKVVEMGETKGPQIGLGLTFARQVAEAHGGRLWMEPNEPRGSIFRLQV